MDFEYVAMGDQSLISLLEQHGVKAEMAPAVAEYNGLPQAYASVMSVLPNGTTIRVPGTYFGPNASVGTTTTNVPTSATDSSKTMLYVGIGILALVFLSSQK